MGGIKTALETERLAMKRRTFIKALGAALLAPFVPSTVKKAIPDPWREEYAKRYVLYPEYDPNFNNHIDDTLRYSNGYYAFDQWTKREMAQMELNKHRALGLNRIHPLVLKRIKTNDRL